MDPITLEVWANRVHRIKLALNRNSVCAQALQRCRYACTIRRVRLCAIVNVAVLHFLIGVAHSTRRVIEQALLFLLAQHAEQIAPLRIVVGIDPVIPVIRSTVERERRLRVLWLPLPLALTVGLITEGTAL